MTNQKGPEEEKEKFLAIIDSFTDGLMVFDQEDKLSLINPAAKKFFEVDKEILGKSISDFLNITGLKNLFYLLGEEFQEVFKKELEVRENLILEVTSRPILKEGKKIGNLIIFHNITKEKTIERIKIDFVTVSAHQLRTPLSAINWSLETLLGEKLGKLTEGQKKVLQETYISNKRILAIIDHFLDVAKIEEGKESGKFIFSDFEKLVQSTINLYQEKIKEKQIKFEFRVLSEKLPKIKIDIEKMNIVLQNLLDNAIRYTLSGDMITIELKADKEKMEFSIQDTGIGIPGDQQENVFKKFFRGANALKIETEGNGLGLFITKKNIEAHGGKIWFESEEGRGTTFYFTLPIKQS